MSDERTKRARSPNYPAQGLRTSIEQAEKLFKKIHTHPAPRDVVVQGLGYSSYNGASGGALSAQLKYGLLMKIGEDYKLTDRAMAILHPRSAGEKAGAIEDAARAPALFAELLDQYNGHIPDDQLLRANLIRNGFVASAVSPAIQAFRETVELLERHAADKKLSSPLEARPEPTATEFASESAVKQAEMGSVAGNPNPSGAVHLAAHSGVPPQEGEREFLYGPLSRSVSYRILVRGVIGPKELGKLIKLLDVQRSLLEDDDGDELPQTE